MDIITFTKSNIKYNGEPNFKRQSLNPHDLPEITFAEDVPEIIRNCLRIEQLVFKYPVKAPIKAHFSQDKKNNTFFIIKDIRRIARFKNIEHFKIKLFDGKTEKEIVNKEDNDKLVMILDKFAKPDLISVYMRAYNAGASFIKLLFGGEAYLSKYVNIVSGKPRIGHTILTTSKKVVSVVMFIGFIGSAVVLGPEIMVPVLLAVM